jgi:seryl-tRNA synthetase
MRIFAGHFFIMLQIQIIREDSAAVAERLAVKHFDGKQILSDILSIDSRRRSTQNELDTLQSEANQLARQIGELMKGGKKAEAEDLKNKSAALKESTKKLGEELSALEQQQHDLLVLLPNLPSREVPPGKMPADNVIVLEEAVKPSLPDGALPHWELAAKYDLIDFELGVKITGAGFPVYKGKGARLQRALVQFFLDEAVAAGYTEYQPPILVNEDSGFGTGQLPDKEGQMYHATADNLYLIPTAEVPLTNIFRDEIRKAEELPIRLCAYTPCFRREAGSYGKDVRGLNRLHQFDKVEIVQVEHPDRSYATLESMKEHVASLLRKLQLPFRIVRLCGGDMSFASALTYDFEVFSAAQEKWLEVSSVSNFETFQANRMKLRFRDSDGKNRLAHTLNGSALALPRIVAALLENNQQASGVLLPSCLHPYTGFDRITA